MPQAYAQALWNLIERGIKLRAAVEKIHLVLKSRSREALMPMISRAFRRLAQREELKNQSILSVANKKDERAARRASGARDAELSIDETLIGGWRLIDKGHLTDASWKSGLMSIYNATTKT